MRIEWFGILRHFGKLSAGRLTNRSPTNFQNFVSNLTGFENLSGLAFGYYLILIP
jgi:hypothetical protein